jgi:hypothetical protein
MDVGKVMPHRNDRMFFWHIPKTGGRWVLEALSRRRACAGLSRVKRVQPEEKPLMLFGHHAPPGQVAEELKRDRFHFCFVRHPINWYRSWWAYRVRRGRTDKRHYADRYHREDCDEFVNVMLDEHPNGFVTELFQLYVGLHADQMDYVGRTENLLSDLKEICRRAGQPVKVPFDELAPINVSSTLPEIARRAVVTPSTAERVNAVEHWVLENFYA